jgi:ABC-type transporter Mla subunit MlaD
MRKNSKFVSKEKKEIKIILIIVILFLGFVFMYFYNSANYVIIRFDELGALTKNMVAYYNGFKIGKIVRIDPDKDFKHTLVKVNLTHKDLNLPQNTTVHVENFPNGELYLEFLYPSSPSFKTIKRGDILEGVAPYSLEQFMLGQNISGVSDIVSLHVIKALNATEIANMEMTKFFHNTSGLINENRKGVKASVDNTKAMTKSLAQMAENLNQTSKNINQVSKKLNSALDEAILKDTTSNIKVTTENISKATKDIDKTMQKIDDTISHANATAENLNVITEGVKATLSKKFAGMRIMFGTPVNQEKCKINPCK